MGKEILGGYFTYCQWCVYDGNCELKHNEFMGVPTDGKPGKFEHEHEDLSVGFTAFQTESPRATCAGRIKVSDSFYLPLYCECGTVISSLTFQQLAGQFCAKFEPNGKGQERFELAQQIAERKNIPLSKVRPSDLPEPDPNYVAVMIY